MIYKPRSSVNCSADMSCSQVRLVFLFNIGKPGWTNWIYTINHVTFIFSKDFSRYCVWCILRKVYFERVYIFKSGFVSLLCIQFYYANPKVDNKICWDVGETKSSNFNLKLYLILVNSLQNNTLISHKYIHIFYHRYWIWHSY